VKALIRCNSKTQPLCIWLLWRPDAGLQVPENESSAVERKDVMSQFVMLLKILEIANPRFEMLECCRLARKLVLFRAAAM
jgi:hypothetical protein